MTDNLKTPTTEGSLLVRSMLTELSPQLSLIYTPAYDPDATRIGIGRTHTQISHPLIAAIAHAAVLCSQLFNPVMPLSIFLGELVLFHCWERGGKWWRCWRLLLLIGDTARLFLWRALLFSPLGCFTEQTLQMRFDIKARLERVLSGIGFYLGTIEVLH